MADGIAEWLEGIGLGEYANSFAENKIEVSDLPHLEEDDFKELGLPIGPRRRLQAAIKRLDGDETGFADGAGAPAGKRSATISPEAERRQLTVLFCDLVGSTALSAKLDPEDMRAVMRDYQEASTAEVERYGGYVAKFMGDGIYCYFGYPRAHEDDAERAIYAGLGIVEAVGELGRDLAVRVGIATGIVVVGDLIGKGAAEEAAITGETPNLAARLLELAEPDTVVIADRTRQLAGRVFEYKDFGSHALKGFADEVSAAAVIRARRAESRFDVVRSGALTDLVGREDEIELLVRRWARAKAGEGQVILISGEPGIGKSRIIRALQERIADDPHVPLLLQCSPFHTNSAFHPLIDNLERTAGFEQTDDVAAKLEKLEAWITLADAPIETTTPVFAGLLSLQTGERYPPLTLSPERQKEQILHHLTNRVVRIAAEQPVLLVLEDAHWIDPSTLEFLELAVEQTPGNAAMIVITYRPEFEAPWVGRPRVTLISLNRLDEAGSAAMAHHVAGGKTLPQEVLAQIIAKTDGVPLFVEELTRSVLESGLLFEEANRYALNGPLPELAIPTTLQDTLEARLDRLATVRDIAQIGAAIGRTFDYGLLSIVSTLDKSDLESGLSRLIDSGLAFQRGAPPNATYTFKHALIQDTAYGSLLRSRRSELHSRIAEAVERHFPETAEAQPELLAHHFTEAGLSEAGTSYWLRAGEAALKRSAMLEGLAHLEKGLGVCETLGPGKARDELLVRLHLARASALRQARGPTHPDVTQSYARARELSQGLDDSHLQFSATVGWLAANYARAESANVTEHAHDLVDLAGSDPAQLGVANMVVGEIQWANGDSESAVTHLRRATELYDPANHAITAIEYGRDFGVFGSGFLSWALAGLGRLDQSLEVMRNLTDLARTQPRSFFHLYALTFENCLLMLMRDANRLGKTAADLIELGNQERFPASVHLATIHAGWARSLREEDHDGAANMERVISEQRFPLWLRPWYDAMLAEVHLCHRRFLEASKVVEQTLDWSRKCGIVHYDGPLLIISGDAFFGLGPTYEQNVEACYEAAIDIARSQSAKLFELRAATRLARLWQSQGKTDEARNLLAPIYNWFTEGFDTADLKEAKALLEELA